MAEPVTPGTAPATELTIPADDQAAELWKNMGVEPGQPFAVEDQTDEKSTPVKPEAPKLTPEQELQKKIDDIIQMAQNSQGEVDIDLLITRAKINGKEKTADAVPRIRKLWQGILDNKYSIAAGTVVGFAVRRGLQTLDLSSPVFAVTKGAIAGLAIGVAKEGLTVRQEKKIRASSEKLLSDYLKSNESAIAREIQTKLEEKIKDKPEFRNYIGRYVKAGAKGALAGAVGSLIGFEIAHYAGDYLSGHFSGALNTVKEFASNRLNLGGAGATVSEVAKNNPDVTNAGHVGVSPEAHGSRVQSMMEWWQNHRPNARSYVLEGNGGTGGNIPFTEANLQEMAKAAQSSDSWHYLQDEIAKYAQGHGDHESYNRIWKNLADHGFNPGQEIHGKPLINYVTELGNRAKNRNVSDGIYKWLSHFNDGDVAKMDFHGLSPDKFADRLASWGTMDHNLFHHAFGIENPDLGQPSTHASTSPGAPGSHEAGTSGTPPTESQPGIGGDQPPTIPESGSWLTLRNAEIAAGVAGLALLAGGVIKNRNKIGESLNKVREKFGKEKESKPGLPDLITENGQTHKVDKGLTANLYGAMAEPDNYDGMTPQEKDAHYKKVETNVLAVLENAQKAGKALYLPNEHKIIDINDISSIRCSRSAVADFIIMKDGSEHSLNWGKQIIEAAPIKTDDEAMKQYDELETSWNQDWWKLDHPEKRAEARKMEAKYNQMLATAGQRGLNLIVNDKIYPIDSKTKFDFNQNKDYFILVGGSRIVWPPKNFSIIEGDKAAQAAAPEATQEKTGPQKEGWLEHRRRKAQETRTNKEHQRNPKVGMLFHGTLHTSKGKVKGEWRVQEIQSDGSVVVWADDHEAMRSLASVGYTQGPPSLKYHLENWRNQSGLSLIMERSTHSEDTNKQPSARVVDNPPTPATVPETPPKETAPSPKPPLELGQVWEGLVHSREGALPGQWVVSESAPGDTFVIEPANDEATAFNKKFNGRQLLVGRNRPEPTARVVSRVETTPAAEETRKPVETAAAEAAPTITTPEFNPNNLESVKARFEGKQIHIAKTIDIVGGTLSGDYDVLSVNKDEVGVTVEMRDPQNNTYDIDARRLKNIPESDIKPRI